MHCHATRTSAGRGHQGPAAAQLRSNRTSLPDDLKAGMEARSGLSLDRVRVRYNSPEPARFGALAMARGMLIDVALGQERHLPHELGHVVQQMRGQVPATILRHGVPLNDDPRLEAEADRLGARALPAFARRDASFIGVGGSEPPPAPRFAAAPLASSTAPVQLTKKRAGEDPTSPEEDGSLAKRLRSSAENYKPVDYRGLEKGGGGGAAAGKNPDFIYPPNVRKILARPGLWDIRTRWGMTDKVTDAILDQAKTAKAPGSGIAYTSQEDQAIGVGPSYTLGAYNNSRNHKLADSAIYAIFGDMVINAAADRGWEPKHDDAVDELIEALHGNKNVKKTNPYLKVNPYTAVKKHLKAAAAAKDDRAMGGQIIKATGYASHGLNNLRIGDAVLNTDIGSAFDSNVTSAIDYVDNDPYGEINHPASSRDGLNAVFGPPAPPSTWADIKHPPLRRRGTLRSEAIRKAVLKLARDRLIDKDLAVSAVTSAYHKTSGEPMSSSSAVN